MFCKALGGGKVVLVAMSVPLALLGNILRVANLIVVARFLGVDAAFTFYHDFSGPLFLRSCFCFSIH